MINDLRFVLSKCFKLFVIQPVILILLCFCSQAFSEDLRIKINSGQVEPLPIAIANFTGSEEITNTIGMQISSVISNNLVSSGQFKAIESAAFIAPPTSPSVRPNFTDWTPLGIKALITGSVKNLNNEQIEVEFRLWDVIAETDLIGLRLSVTSKHGEELRILSLTKYLKDYLEIVGILTQELCMFLNLDLKINEKKDLLLWTKMARITNF